jgi:hypothetical protein
MTRASTQDYSVGIGAKPKSFWQGLREISMFFEGRDDVHKSMRRLARKLEKAKIPYAVVGGMAVFAHHYRRTTNDVDFLVNQQGFDEFQRLLVPKSYAPIPKRPRRFVDQVNKVTVDFLVAGHFPGSGKPGPIRYPDPADVSQIIEKIQVVNLTNLIQLKLGARRYQDFADVVNLIRFNQLDESFLDRLHPSVRGDFIECLEEKRREEEYEARED